MSKWTSVKLFCYDISISEIGEWWIPYKRNEWLNNVFIRQVKLHYDLLKTMTASAIVSFLNCIFQYLKLELIFWNVAL